MIKTSYLIMSIPVFFFGIILSSMANAGSAVELDLLATLDIGKAPHQISFSADGKRAFVAAAGSDWIAEIDTGSLELRVKIPAPNIPLGVFPLADGASLAISQFAIDALVRIGLDRQQEIARLDVGGAPSLFAGPLPDDRWLIVSEKANRLSVIDGRLFRVLASYDTGNRPFPAAATPDGRKAFVPNYNDGTITVVDLWNSSILATIPVGAKPSGGIVLPDGNTYAVAVRGENRIALINTASHEIIKVISEGIGQEPFSVVTEPGGRWAFVNNTVSHDISVIDLETEQVVSRFSVPRIPIVLAVHPSGRSLWVASEGDHLLSIYAIPEPPQPPPLTAGANATEVLVMGMIHSRHLSSQQWGLDQVRQTIRNIKPEVVCVEIPPAHWATAWPEYLASGKVTDDRIVRFPEYVDVLLPLQAEMGFEIEPCAGWTREMARLRQARMKAWNEEDRYQAARQAYELENEELAAAGLLNTDEIDDPLVIHSEAYDESVRAELSIYDRYLNEHIGPGGWSNINQAHYALIDTVINRHRGKRILVTFGAGHKYWFLDQLRQRADVNLLDLKPFLPSAIEDSSMTVCLPEIEDLHLFFQEWMAGRLPPDNSEFTRLEQSLANEFQRVTPEGHLQQREVLIEQLRGAHAVHAGDPSFRIWIKECQSRELADGVQAVSYEEWQTIKGQTRARMSTAIFQQSDTAPNGWQWLQLQETWIESD